MNPDDFKTKLESLFGNYNDEQGRYVLLWASKRPEKVLKLITADLIRTWSLQFKAMPFITDFEQRERTSYEKLDRENQSKRLPEPGLSDTEHAELLKIIHKITEKYK